MRSRTGNVLIIALFLLSVTYRSGAQVLVESVAGIVGNEVIYLSDIENRVLELRSNGNKSPVSEIRCDVLQDLLISKLFIDQARIDSIEVTPDMVEGQLNIQMNDAIRRAGSEKTLEEYFKKDISEIRNDIRKALLEQTVVREVQGTIAQGITLTPNELKRFYNSIPKDSLPVVPARVKLSIIQLDPPENEENKAEARQKLLDIRSKILAGQSFNVMAMMYSEDPGNATKGGELGFMLKGELEKPYADAAWSLTKGSISRIVESRYGFHLIQLIDKNGDMANTRHILIKPKVKPNQITRAMSKLDSIANLIRIDSISFQDAARKFSSHKDSRTNGGDFVNADPSRRDTWFALEELNAEMYSQVRELKVGEISEPFRTTDEDGNMVFRIVKLDSEVPAHRANLTDDYNELYNAAMGDKQSKTYEEWMSKKIEKTYIRVSDELKSCEFLKQGWLK